MTSSDLSGVKNMADVYKNMDMAVKLGVNLEYELPLKKYGTWVLSFRKVGES